MSTSRRGFLKGILGTGAAGAAATLPACAPDINPAPVTDVTASSEGVVSLLVTRYPDLEPVGGALTVRVAGEDEPVLVTHTAKDEFSVLSSICTHAACPLGFDGREVVCPCHLSKFNPVDGTVTQRPATVGLRKFSSKYNPATQVLSIDLRAGESGFPAAVNGEVRLPFAQFPTLRDNGSVVDGVPSGYGKRIFVFRQEDGTLSAVDSVCTHQGCEVQANQEELNLVCPCHMSIFSATGDAVSGVATLPLKKFTATETADEVVLTGVQ
ncbi:Rieske 2Fe-2S domain-containing protein [Myxococcus stipitatus]|uniref:Rieske 2Fe-2S domain-containing protein n=1 Tax=Myxococcus stipitatus TaxID=83455 RepID=UPI001F442E27|nr:Rieske 2Fe-2S domain-containing protein [Myxococcus stipitatus]MCE9668309.1 Rieske 2Fe-2S domain-containing protein [Myxococcus stipitatus]